MPALSLHPDTTPVVQTVQSIANHQNQQNRGPLGNSQHPPAKRHISIPAGKRDTSQGGSSIPSTIQGQNSTPLSSLNNSHIADITQQVASTLSATLRWSINTPNAKLGTSSNSPPAPGGTLQTDSTRRIVSSLESGIASPPTPLSGFENLPTRIPNPEAHAIIIHPLPIRATERNQRWAVTIATAGGVYTSIHGLRQLQHPYIWSHRYEASGICNGQTPGALHVEQMAVYEWKQLGDGKSCNATHCKSIS
jgi:hypothetical protein